MIGVFLGAALGALFGYAASHWQGKQEATARRRALFRVLSDQLHMIPADDPPYDPQSIQARDTIHVSAAGQLLSGQTLDAQSDGLIIRRLILWQAVEAGHNEVVRFTNQALALGALPESHRAAWYDHLNFRVGLMRACRADVLAALPVAYRQPSWPVAETGPPDAGLLVQRHLP